MSGQYQERKEYFKQYREKNKERLQQKRHDFYEENKGRIKEYSKQWKQDNPSMVWLLTEPSDNDEIWSRHDIHELAHAFGLHLELVCVCVCVLCVYCPQLLRPHCRLGTITHTHVCVLLLRCHALHVSSSSYKLCAAASAQSHTHTHTLSLSLSLSLSHYAGRASSTPQKHLHSTPYHQCNPEPL